MTQVVFVSVDLLLLGIADDDGRKNLRFVSKDLQVRKSVNLWEKLMILYRDFGEDL